MALTDAQFARHAAQLSQAAARCAAEILEYSQDLQAIAYQAVIRRFVADMRGRLDWLEARAAELPDGDGSG